MLLNSSRKVLSVLLVVSLTLGSVPADGLAAQRPLQAPAFNEQALTLALRTPIRPFSVSAKVAMVVAVIGVGASVFTGASHTSADLPISGETLNAFGPFLYSIFRLTSRLKTEEYGGEPSLARRTLLGVPLTTVPLLGQLARRLDPSQAVTIIKESHLSKEMGDLLGQELAGPADMVNPQTRSAALYRMRVEQWKKRIATTIREQEKEQRVLLPLLMQATAPVWVGVELAPAELQRLANQANRNYRALVSFMKRAGVPNSEEEAAQFFRALFGVPLYLYARPDLVPAGRITLVPLEDPTLRDAQGAIGAQETAILRKLQTSTWPGVPPGALKAFLAKFDAVVNSPRAPTSAEFAAPIKSLRNPDAITLATELINWRIQFYAVARKRDGAIAKLIRGIKGRLIVVIGRHHGDNLKRLLEAERPVTTIDISAVRVEETSPQSDKRDIAGYKRGLGRRTLLGFVLSLALLDGQVARRLDPSSTVTIFEDIHLDPFKYPLLLNDLQGAGAGDMSRPTSPGAQAYRARVHRWQKELIPLIARQEKEQKELMNFLLRHSGALTIGVEMTPSSLSFITNARQNYANLVTNLTRAGFADAEKVATQLIQALWGVGILPAARPELYPKRDLNYLALEDEELSRQQLISAQTLNEVIDKVNAALLAPRVPDTARKAFGSYFDAIRNRTRTVQTAQLQVVINALVDPQARLMATESIKVLQEFLRIARQREQFAVRLIRERKGRILIIMGQGHSAMLQRMLQSTRPVERIKISEYRPPLQVVPTNKHLFAAS